MRHPRWEWVRPLLASPMAKATVFIPLVGYSLLFSDFVRDVWSFDSLTGETNISISTWRQRCVYFGLILLAASQVIYHLRAHRIVRRYEVASDLLASEGNFLQRVHWPDNEFNRISGIHLLQDEIRIERSAYGTENALAGSIAVIFEAAQKLNPISIRACILTAAIGYALLIIPSADLFVRVLRTVL